MYLFASRLHSRPVSLFADVPFACSCFNMKQVRSVSVTCRPWTTADIMIMDSPYTSEKGAIDALGPVI